MEKKERLATIANVSSKLVKDILLKKDKVLINEEFRLLSWHLGQIFKKKI
jgi:hypothetical protein